MLQTEDQRQGEEVVVNKQYGHTSFSGLVSHGTPPTRIDDRYDFDQEDEKEPDEYAAVADERGNGTAIFDFPAGARTGECWHRVFEELDFTLLREGDDPAAIDRARGIVDEQLGLFRLCKGQTEAEVQAGREVVFTMVQNVLRAPLAFGEKTLRLCDVPAQETRTEMGFSFALRRRESPVAARTTILRDVLARHWGGVPERALFLERLDSWDQEIPRGFMTGFIDLVFREGGKYFILDWKSNRRNRQPEDFEPAGLREEMAAHAYFLQYLIYTVALHNYLRGALPGYDYERDFGGVFYIFLRGVDPGHPGRGVYHDKPSLELIDELAQELGEFSTDST